MTRFIMIHHAAVVSALNRLKPLMAAMGTRTTLLLYGGGARSPPLSLLATYRLLIRAQSAGAPRARSASANAKMLAMIVLHVFAHHGGPTSV